MDMLSRSVQASTGVHEHNSAKYICLWTSLSDQFSQEVQVSMDKLIRSVQPRSTGVYGHAYQFSLAKYRFLKLYGHAYQIHLAKYRCLWMCASDQDN